ncbi:universal stress family protein [Gleimia coleocanis DSM 15436]|uniref:Universal stress family protein n=1 Tax=Gleimia coleocanis DSM 15436 TaxID=525245 RepID=C0VYL9_9ACTO|nr:universal stress protein [Gleimia coleocanis]EEH64522.1 universal stress family protein [Gleimia coleocanis DSM 15436]
MATKPTILVGVDGSTESYNAVDWAGAYAKHYGAQVHVLCTYGLASYTSSSLEPGYISINETKLKETAERAVEEGLARLAPYQVEAASSIEIGDAAGVMVGHSHRVKMIVVGSRGGGNFLDRLLGSVSASLPVHSDCPVVVVPEHTSGSPFMPIRRIVVGADGSEVSSNALKAAVDEAIQWDAELTAVSALPYSTGAGMFAWMLAAVDRSQLLTEMRSGLAKAVTEALAGRPREIKQHVLDGSPAELLTEFSTAVDLIVVGNRGRSGIQGLILGSTSQSVLEQSTCPVMVVSSRKHAHADQEYPESPEWTRR